MEREGRKEEGEERGGGRREGREGREGRKEEGEERGEREGEGRGQRRGE